MPRVLVIKPSSLGDIVHGLQVVQGIREQRPDLSISWVVRDRFADLVEAAPCVHDIIIFERRKGLRGMWRLLRELRDRQFDYVFDMQGLLRTGLMTGAARSPKKWGRRDAREGAGFFYNGRIDLPPGVSVGELGDQHAIDVLKPFAKACGVEPRITFPLVLRDAPKFSWSAFFAGSDPTRTFVIFPDSRGANKEWPHFNELTRKLFETIPDARIAWCAGAATAPTFAPPAGRFLNLAGCPLPEMIALVRQPSIFIGNDSGPMHLSAAVGNRVLAIFGPTPPERFGPYPLSDWRHVAVRAPGGVLADLPADTVVEAVNDLRTRHG